VDLQGSLKTGSLVLTDPLFAFLFRSHWFDDLTRHKHFPRLLRRRSGHELGRRGRRGTAHKGESLLSSTRLSKLNIARLLFLSSPRVLTSELDHRSIPSVLRADATPSFYSLIDTIIFTALGSVFPFDVWFSSSSPISFGRLLSLSVLVLLFRRLPGVLLFSKGLPAISTWGKTWFVDASLSTTFFLTDPLAHGYLSSSQLSRLVRAHGYWSSLLRSRSRCWLSKSCDSDLHDRLLHHLCLDIRTRIDYT